jgi:hypothetical protein
MPMSLRVATLLALLLFVVACGAKQTNEESESEECVTEQTMLVAELEEGKTCEVIADFGVVTHRAIVEMPIRVVNATDEPIVLVDYSTTCRCTMLDLDRAPIEAGGECEIVLTFDSRGEWGGVGNFLDITTSNPECGFVIWMGATVE